MRAYAFLRLRLGSASLLPRLYLVCLPCLSIVFASSLPRLCLVCVAFTWSVIGLCFVFASKWQRFASHLPCRCFVFALRYSPHLCLSLLRLCVVFASRLPLSCPVGASWLPCLCLVCVSSAYGVLNFVCVVVASVFLKIPKFRGPKPTNHETS